MTAHKSFKRLVWARMEKLASVTPPPGGARRRSCLT
jgi:hypothetical protein